MSFIGAGLSQGLICTKGVHLGLMHRSGLYKGVSSRQRWPLGLGGVPVWASKSSSVLQVHTESLKNYHPSFSPSFSSFLFQPSSLEAFF